jgi:hypothetical protein
MKMKETERGERGISSPSDKDVTLIYVLTVDLLVFYLFLYLLVLSTDFFLHLLVKIKKKGTKRTIDNSY